MQMNFGEEPMEEPEKTGTTIMAATFNGGVVLGADSRTSRGPLVANRVTDKLTRVTDFVYCCRSGSAADTQSIAEMVSSAMEYKAVCDGEEPLVAFVANQFRAYSHGNRAALKAGFIVAGWDKRKGAQVYSVPVGGFIIERKIAIGGSGSAALIGFVDEFYREKMKKEECIEFVKKAVEHAIHFDGSSGGVVRIGIITSEGMERKTYYNTETGEVVFPGY